MDTLSSDPSSSCGDSSCGSDVDGGGGQSTLAQVVLNLVAAGLGTGVFSLPWSMAGASLLQGVATTAGIMALNAWSSMIIVEASERHHIFDMGGLVALLPGQLLPGRLGASLPGLGTLVQAFINVMIWVTHWVTLISYLIAIHDSASALLNQPADAPRWPLVTGAALLVLPLNFIDLGSLSLVSAISLLMNFYMLGWLGIEFASRARAGELPEDVCMLGVGRGGVAMFGAIAHCAALQMCMPPIYADLERRSTRRFSCALWAAYTMLAGVYIAFEVLGYYINGSGVQSNILLGIPVTPATLVVQVGAIAVTAPVYPMMVLPMVAAVADVKCFKLAAEGGEADLRAKKRVLTGVTVAIVFVSYLGALMVKELGFINVVNGAISAWAFTAVVPGLVGLHLVAHTGLAWRFMMFALFAFGFVSFVFGVYYSDNYEEDLATGCGAYGRTSLLT